MSPNHHIITRILPKWRLLDFLTFQAGQSAVYTNDDKIRVYGVREITKSEFFEHPYCIAAPYEPYYMSPEELIKDHPTIDPTIYDYDNNLQIWKES